MASIYPSIHVLAPGTSARNPSSALREAAMNEGFYILNISTVGLGAQMNLHISDVGAHTVDGVPMPKIMYLPKIAKKSKKSKKSKKNRRSEDGEESVSAVEPNKAVMRRKPLDWDQIYRDMAKMAGTV
jgi:hypothetical protein